ncbi:Endonuclease/Exonuclease/phosphatase family [Metamycoplasma arthritidis]|uniref:Membrane nuclease A n=2 Tax=Metamycoplasmataceae TaxID=2895623 RepID=B3PLX8_META1|nr:membrane nuclease A [Metamycoplasma arthritidis 158L3-1]VEU78558.1 Endonuclease/Exonuclease/phosphatase family [Metamycoplasma arthritidis]
MKSLKVSLLVATPIITLPLFTISCIPNNESKSYQDLNAKANQAAILLKQKQINSNKLEELIDSILPEGTELEILDLWVDRENKEINVKFRLRYKDRRYPYSSDVKIIKLKYESILENLKPQEKPKEKPGRKSKEKNPKTQNDEKSKDGLNKKSNGKQKMKWGHWNVLKLSDKNDKKIAAIAALIKKIDYDVVGLTEVFSEEAVKEVVAQLNKLAGSGTYSYVASKKLKGSYAGNLQAEHVGVIYNSQKIKTIPFEKTKNNKKEIGYSYIEKFNSEFIKKHNKAEYVRPPYGVKFQWLKGKKEDFTFVFDHFDSPGGSKGEGTTSGVGNQELAEARQLANVLDHFDEIDGENEDIFFSGDTNIKAGKEKFAFGEELFKKYQSAFKDNLEFATSLGIKAGNYSQPYDKMFTKTKFKTSNHGIYKLWDLSKDDEFTNLFKELHNGKIETSEIRKLVSDHAPIYSEVEFE